MQDSDVICQEEYGRKYFTVAQADRALVLVRRITDDVSSDYACLLELQEEVEAPRREPSSVRAPGDLRAEILRTVERLHHHLEELDLVGVELQDWAAGVVDFPCVASGREVRLCWRRGEPAVRYWHHVNAGCEARCTLDALPSCAALVPEGAGFPAR
jgi:hypothetical protein